MASPLPMGHPMLTSRNASLVFIFLATLVAGCSDSTHVTPPVGPTDASADSPEDAPDDAPVVTTEAAADSPSDQATPDASACVCDAVGDAGLSETSLGCFCRTGCRDYAAAVADLCSHPYVFGVVESTFTGCNLKRINYIVGVSSTSSFYDATSGAFVGGRYDDDTPGVCPGTSQAIGFSLVAGTYELPASCQLASQRTLCGDGG